MKIKILATGGTIDKIYYDANNDFHIGEPMSSNILEEANVTFDYEIESILKKDSLDINDEDRAMIRQKVVELLDIEGKTIVITGAMQPARMRTSDSGYNMGVAATAVQLLPTGVYVAMNGLIFDPRTTVKNIALSRFEAMS